MSDKTDVSSKSYGNIDEEENSCRSVFWIVSRFELHEYIREDCHCETAYPDGISLWKKEKWNTDKHSVHKEEENKTPASDEGFYLISENIEKETIGKEVKKPSMEELIEEKLNNNLRVESLR